MLDVYEEIYNALQTKYGTDTNGQWCVVAGTLTGLLYTLVLPNNVESSDSAFIDINLSNTTHIIPLLSPDDTISIDVAILTNRIHAQISADIIISNTDVVLSNILGRSSQDNIASADTFTMLCILGRSNQDNITSADVIALSLLQPELCSDIAVANTGMVAVHILSRNWIDSITVTEVVRHR